MKNLNEMNLVSLNKNEISKTNGGIFGIDDFLVGVAVGAVIAIIDDWDNFEAGLTGKDPIPN